MNRLCSLSLLKEAFLGFFFAFSTGSCEGLGGGGWEEDECRDARRDSTRPAKDLFVFCFTRVNSLDQSIVASTLIKIMNADSHSEWYWVIWSFMELLSFVATILVGDVLNITNRKQRWDSCDTLRILRHEVRDPRIFAPCHTSNWIIFIFRFNDYLIGCAMKPKQNDVCHCQMIEAIFCKHCEMWLNGPTQWNPWKIHWLDSTRLWVWRR